MKVAMDIEVAIAANSTNNNVLQGEQYQTIPFDAVLKLLETGSAAGLRRTLNVAGRSIISRGFVNSQNRTPIEPDDVVIGDVEAYQGQQVFLQVENTTAGALTYRARIWVEQAVAV